MREPSTGQTQWERAVCPVPTINDSLGQPWPNLTHSGLCRGVIPALCWNFFFRAWESPILGGWCCWMVAPRGLCQVVHLLNISDKKCCWSSGKISFYQEHLQMGLKPFESPKRAEHITILCSEKTHLEIQIIQNYWVIDLGTFLKSWKFWTEFEEFLNCLSLSALNF